MWESFLYIILYFEAIPTSLLTECDVRRPHAFFFFVVFGKRSQNALKKYILIMSGWVLGILGIIGYIIISFLMDLKKDDYDLQETTVAEKFKFIVRKLNEVVYHGEGKVTVLDARTFNLYAQGSNQIIQFFYATGSLTITWKYKYLQKEVVHERNVNDARNLSVLSQERIAENLIKEMGEVVRKHQIDVLIND